MERMSENIELKVSLLKRTWVRRTVIVVSLPFVLFGYTPIAAFVAMLQAQYASLRTAMEQW
jgi:hypothetical protein